MLPYIAYMIIHGSYGICLKLAKKHAQRHLRRALSTHFACTANRDEQNKVKEVLGWVWERLELV